MRIILTGPKGNLGYWDGSARVVGSHAFGFQGRFKHQNRCSFARLSAFAGNGNHAPTGHDAAVTSNLGLDLLNKIAGVR
ncbi:MAG: hypothetical protein ACSHWS_11560 [Sulfitobacter sp.]